MGIAKDIIDTISDASSGYVHSKESDELQEEISQQEQTIQALRSQKQREDMELDYNATLVKLALLQQESQKAAAELHILTDKAQNGHFLNPQDKQRFSELYDEYQAFQTETQRLQRDAVTLIEAGAGSKTMSFIDKDLLDYRAGWHDIYTMLKNYDPERATLGPIRRFIRDSRLKLLSKRIANLRDQKQSEYERFQFMQKNFQSFADDFEISVGKVDSKLLQEVQNHMEQMAQEKMKEHETSHDGPNADERTQDGTRETEGHSSEQSGSNEQPVPPSPEAEKNIPTEADIEKKKAEIAKVLECHKILEEQLKEMEEAYNKAKEEEQAKTPEPEPEQPVTEQTPPIPGEPSPEPEPGSDGADSFSLDKTMEKLTQEAESADQKYRTGISDIMRRESEILAQSRYDPVKQSSGIYSFSIKENGKKKTYSIEYNGTKFCYKVKEGQERERNLSREAFQKAVYDKTGPRTRASFEYAKSNVHKDFANRNNPSR